ncbi:retention module-containing protein, partial [Methylobacter svalbardensis]|uniref:retention module-containing protein n=1 Tax=Methylobacter svalbardensis TaxID=3080016 RepID=UPI0030ECBCDC
MANLGTVVALNGEASVVNEKGIKRALHQGDVVQTGETIITTNGVIVDLKLVNGRTIQVGSEQTVRFTQELADSIPPDSADSSVDQASIQAVIKAVGEGKDISTVLEETAAGLGASGTSYGFSFVNLLRISEGVTPIDYAYDFSRGAPVDPVIGQVATNPPLEPAPVEDVIASSPVIIINDVNNPPAANNDALTTAEDTPLTIAASALTGNDSDPEGDTYSITGFTQTSNGTLAQNQDGSFTYTPNANYNGGDSFTYTITDSQGATDTATVTINVTPVN